MKKFLIVLIFVLLADLACASMPWIIKSVATLLDVATLLCEVTADENSSALEGVSPRDFCVGSNLDPFIIEVDAAQQRAAAKAGLLK